jgi:hypothetical protein
MRADIAEKPVKPLAKTPALPLKPSGASAGLHVVIKLFSSLRLTVACLCLAVLLVFIGTLAQRDQGLYAAQNRYFRSFFIFWSPPGGAWKIPVFPGGYLLGGVLLINLFAAHATRFKFSKKKIGIFTIHAGLVLLILGQFATDMVSTEGGMQIFEGETKNFSEDFHTSELVVIDTSSPEKDHVISIPESFVAGKKDIRHESLPVTLRVHRYWRNCSVQDVPPPEAAPTGADQGLFTNHLLLPLSESDDASQQRRAAVLVEVLSEKGSLGTFLVPARTEERQTFRYQNRDWSISLLFAPMMGGNQLVISGGEGASGMIAFPESEFSQKGELRREGFPLKLNVKQFYPNARLFSKPGPQTVMPKVDQGALRSIQVTELAPVTDTDHRNFPGATVEVVSDKGSLGTFFVYSGVSAHQHFLANGKPWELAMRFKRHYYPFTVTLLKATHETYRGRPDIPKNFASLVRVENPAGNEARETKISMNNPLRYAGLTFFQYQMTAGDMAQKRGLTPSSVLQVVSNPSWRTPYIACVMIAGGLLIQFLSHLVGFAMKQKSR